MKPRNWYRVEMSSSDPTIADISIIDFIGDWIDDLFGFGVTAKAFVAELAQLPQGVKTIRVHINSPGGDVFGALNIANALRDQRVTNGRRIEMHVDGLVASAASVIIMAGDVIRMADNALVMIHNPWTIAVGEAKDFVKLAENLTKIRSTIIATYRWHSTLEDDAIAELMDAATWMDADEAIANGFATEKVAGLQAAASLDPRFTAKLTVPDKYRDRVAAMHKQTPTPPAAASPVAVIKACTAAGLLDMAEGLIDAGLTLEAVTAQITTEKTTRAAAETRRREIEAICQAADMPELSAGYVAGAMAVSDVRKHVTTITAKVDKAEIDTGLKPDGGGPGAKSRIDTKGIYESRKAARN